MFNYIKNIINIYKYISQINDVVNIVRKMKDSNVIQLKIHTYFSKQN